jgi:hypothetical protein
MTEHVPESATQHTEALYPPSWIDRLIAWIERLPGPAWLFYGLSVLGFAVIFNAVFWIDGSLLVGSFNTINTGFGIFIVYCLCLYRYLTGVGSRSLHTFRPLLDADDSEIARIDYELATLPRRIGWLAIPLGIGFAAASILVDPEPYGDLVPQTALPYVGDIVITSFVMSTFICLSLRSIRQLRMVRRLHARATNISLLKLDPAHAFSALTARSGIGIILVLIVAFILDPTILGSTLDILSIVVTSLLAIAIFILPIMGIRDHLEKEKQRVLDEMSDLLQATSDRLHNRLRKDNYTGIGDTKAAIEALIRERELMEKISTWPWNPRTLRGFASALLLPVFLLLVTRLLERFL